MRVISGTAKRHNLKTVDGLDTRPTTDRIKETLFNIMPIEYDMNFLDLFSGSGAIGIEALSRGASSAVFVDKSLECTKIIKENLEHTKLTQNAIIYTMEIDKAIEKVMSEDRKFDIIFMDPPYDKGLINLTLKKILECGILKQNGYVVIESSQNEIWDITEQFELYKEREFKITKITILKM